MSTSSPADVARGADHRLAQGPGGTRPGMEHDEQVAGGRTITAGAGIRGHAARRSPSNRDRLSHAMTEPLRTRYTTTSEGTYLAYQISGDGPMDLVIPITGSAAIELIWDEPAFSRFVSRLASFSRLITFDPRGFGSSGRLDPDSIPAVQTWKDDIVAIMDAAGSRQAALLAWGESAGGDDVLRGNLPGANDEPRPRQCLCPVCRAARTRRGVCPRASSPTTSGSSRTCGASEGVSRSSLPRLSQPTTHADIGDASSV